MIEIEIMATMTTAAGAMEIMATDAGIEMMTTGVTAVTMISKP